MSLNFHKVEKMKLNNLFLIPLLTLPFFYPSFSLADVKKDIAAYDLPFSQGNYKDAIKLANIALENLKKETNPNQAYFAKIYFDLAYFNGLAGDYKSSLLPATELLTILDKNPDIKNATDINEVNLIYGLASYGAATSQKDRKIAAKILDSATLALEKTERYDDFLIRAYIYLANYAFEDSSWTKMHDYAQKAINTTNSTYKEKSTTRDNYLVIGYLLRAQATLIHGYKKREFFSFTTGTNIIRNADTPIGERHWADALIDIRTAQVIYGKQKSKTDLTFAQLSAWEGVIISYGLTGSSKGAVEKSSQEINKKIGYDDNDLSFFGNELDKTCDDAFKFKYGVGYPSFASSKYSFAATVAAYDIGPDNLPTNVRILASIPTESFAAEVKEGISKSKLLHKANNIPKECLKDRNIIFRFVVQ